MEVASLIVSILTICGFFFGCGLKLGQYLCHKYIQEDNNATRY